MLQLNFQSFIDIFFLSQIIPNYVVSLMDVLHCFSWFLGCCRCFKMFRLAFEGFLGFKVAVNDTQLSQRTTWRCSRCTSSFSPFVVCRLECSPWSRRAEFEAAASLAWPSPCTCRLMIFALRAPQFDAPHVCIVLSSVSSTTNVRHSGMFQFVSSCSGYFSCFFLFSLFVVGFLVSSCSSVFGLLCDVLLCFSWL